VPAILYQPLGVQIAPAIEFFLNGEFHRQLGTPVDLGKALLDPIELPDGAMDHFRQSMELAPQGR
jgi:hypothetical protein